MDTQKTQTEGSQEFFDMFEKTLKGPNQILVGFVCGDFYGNIVRTRKASADEMNKKLAKELNVNLNGMTLKFNPNLLDSQTLYNIICNTALGVFEGQEKKYPNNKFAEKIANALIFNADEAEPKLICGLELDTTGEKTSVNFYDELTPLSSINKGPTNEIQNNR